MLSDISVVMIDISVGLIDISVVLIDIYQVRSDATIFLIMLTDTYSINTISSGIKIAVRHSA